MKQHHHCKRCGKILREYQLDLNNDLSFFCDSCLVSLYRIAQQDVLAKEAKARKP